MMPWSVMRTSTATSFAACFAAAPTFDEILFLSIDVEPDEWKDQVLYLPL